MHLLRRRQRYSAGAVKLRLSLLLLALLALLATLIPSALADVSCLPDGSGEAEQCRDNTPQDCSGVSSSVESLWPPNHSLRTVVLSLPTDGDGEPMNLTITAVTQDEPVNERGDGNTAPDAVVGSDSNEVSLRAERSGRGDGRVYVISFGASSDQGDECSGEVEVYVPTSQGRNAEAVDSGQSFSSFSQ